MSVTFDLPLDLEQSLRKELENIEHAAKEAFAVELYRRGRITQYQLGHVLGLGRFQADALLQRHGIFHDQSLEDVRREAESLRAARGSC